MPPGRAFFEIPVGREAREPGARPRAARGAVVGIPRAKHEVAAIVVFTRGIAEELDVVDLAAVAPRDALGRERSAKGAREFGEWGNVLEIERPVVRIHEEEPVAAPRDVALRAPVPADVDVDALAVAVRHDVLDRYASLRAERAGHRADGCVEAVRPFGNAPQVLKGRDDSDGAVAAHAEVAGVVEVDDRGDGARFHRRHQDAAHDHVG